MLTLHGYGVGDGIASGRALILRRAQPVVDRRQIDVNDIPQEITRFRLAVAGARAELNRVRATLPPDSPPEIAGLVDAHLMMLEDPVIAKEPETIISSEACNAEWALQSRGRALGEIFEAMDDAYNAQTEALDEVFVRARSTNIRINWMGLAWRPAFN